jgi:hypothetical protein
VCPCASIRYALDGHYGDGATNRDVFAAEVQPLLKLAVGGGRATFVCFGQTGTGKTYTAHGMECAIAAALFGSVGEMGGGSVSDDGGGSSGGSGGANGGAPAAEGRIEPQGGARLLPLGAAVDVSAFELRGKQARDLLAGGRLVKLLQVHLPTALACRPVCLP